MTRSNKKLSDALSEFDDMSELVDAFIDRVDLVGKAANGHQFILAKSDSNNMLPAALVRDLIAKANEEIMPEKTAEVAKADLDANTILEDATVTGDVEEVGSAAWESVDAETAAKWAAILGRAKTAICALKDREKEERDELGEDNDEEIEALHDAYEAVEFAISILATFAVLEQAESDAAGELMKSEDVREELVKAGRSLSTANETALRAAADSIQKVLDSLPAPVKVEGETDLGADQEKPEPVKVEEADKKVAKTRTEEIIDMAIEEVEKGDEDAPEAETEEVEKSTVPAEMSDDDLARVALTGADSERKEALQEIGLRALTLGLKSSDAPVEEVVEEATEDVDDAVEEAAEMNEEDGAVTEPADGDLEPAPADEVGTPADEEVTKSHKLKKSVKAKKVEKLVKEARDEESDKYAAIIKSLEDRIATLEAPAPSRVLTNGALPPEHLLRGQNAGAPTIGDATALRKAIDDAPDAVSKSNATEEMRIAALEALTALRTK